MPPVFTKDTKATQSSLSPGGGGGGREIDLSESVVEVGRVEGAVGGVDPRHDVPHLRPHGGGNKTLRGRSGGGVRNGGKILRSRI